MKKFEIIVYSRVSSYAQNLSVQISMAEQYCEREQIDLESAEFINDHNVSATKLKMHQRKGLTELIKLIKHKKVKKLIVYKRDRLARNFYEYTELAKLFIAYDVEVIFTASDEAPFSRSLVFEAFHGMLGQMEGLNIKSRTDDARKQYPSQIFGYKRTKEQNSVSYTAIHEKACLVKSLFEEALHIESAQMFADFLTKKHKFKYDQKLKILSNAFYAGYFEKNGVFQSLSYVEPLTDLDTFKKVSEIIEKYLKDFYTAISNTPIPLFALPTCAVCKEQMKLKKMHPLDSGVIYCSKGHKKNAISVIEYNQQISMTLHEELLKIDDTRLKNTVSNILKREKKQLAQLLKKEQNNYQNILLNLTSSFNSTEYSYNKSIAKLNSLKISIAETTDQITAINDLISETKLLSNYLSTFKLEWRKEDLIQIAELLIEEIIVSFDFTSISLFLTAQRNEVTNVN